MLRDMHGLELSAAGAESAQGFDDIIDGYTRFRADLPDRVARVLEADPEFCLAHCTRGYFILSGFNLSQLPAAAQAAMSARKFAAQVTPREQCHVDALEAWLAGDLNRCLALWESILTEYPVDILALRMAHFIYFWLGRRRDMVASIERVYPVWSAEMPSYGTYLACRAFAHEESGRFVLAEADGRAAVQMNSGDLWATHAVAHVMEMQGRHAEGIAWLARLAPNWVGANNLAHHLWWHWALYHVERGEFDAALDLYDRRFRDLESPLTQAQPDLYIDVQNACSMLFRLERQGVDVGARWVELADKAEARIGDCKSAFTLPHWMMALTACGREAAALRMMDGLRGFAAGAETTAAVVGEIALPACEAVRLYARADYAGCVSTLEPVIGRLVLMGGSHAQQDVLHQLYVDAARRAGLADVIRHAFKAQSAWQPLPAHARAGYHSSAKWLENQA